MGPRSPLTISIHPPRAGWDPLHRQVKRVYPYFNPPTPCGVGHDPVAHVPFPLGISIHPPRAGWDPGPGDARRVLLISIHPPRAGWDIMRTSSRYCSRNFNPPTPCGVGRGESPISVVITIFQSTHPVRGGTRGRSCSSACYLISIHPPRAGWDAWMRICRMKHSTISIHPPRAGWDSKSSQNMTVSFCTCNKIRQIQR